MLEPEAEELSFWDLVEWGAGHVSLARRFTERPVLARALTDRSMFLLAAHQYGESYDDFVEVCALLN
ncbi:MULTISPECIES: hypothetical protein [unclassified Streptomyces]|uniref:hypothetical protein n=1 Tax=unclassified Streptomyces TaxID=2593676 RepID=UPI001574F1C6|nr:MULTISPECIES: hypothetical protein [unclassified Streptomyces]QUC63786.1 hypothetical protein IOD14_18160 [Streptomyces sp. A2-16]